MRELFLAARALDRGERTAFLQRVTADDASLAQEVRDLLAAEEADANFLESPALGREFREQAVGSVVTTHEEQQLERIGPYRVLELVGEGGFARVYAAQQEAPVRRRVAIKLLKPGVATAQVIRRFEAEGQHLASMDHPAIARIFDAGATEDGRPYFIMEYVRGTTIIEFNRQSRRSLRQRLELFLQVCDAVHYAHQRGVIHRDLKPTNILIDTSGPNPVPKVIDFGVAKTIGEGARDDTAHTQAGQLIGTPEYMSPEQAGGTRFDVDTRTDIYSLGVVLYEMLTGTRPLTFTAQQRVDWLKLARLIREQQPPQPSKRILADDTNLALPSQPTAIVPNASPAERQSVQPVPEARTSHSVPTTPARALRGDLDWIVMKCLEKERTDRYESVAALAADIQRHLHCEPVSAGPPSTLYRLRKFVRKHRTPVIAGTTLLVLAAVALTSTIQRVVQDAHMRALAAEAQAADERSRSYGLMLESFLTAPLERGYSATVLDVIDDCDRMLASGELPADAEARIRLRLGEVWRAFGDYDAAHTNLRTARSLYLELGDWVNAAQAELVLANAYDDLESMYLPGPGEDPKTLVAEGLKHVPVADAETWPVRTELLQLQAELTWRRSMQDARAAIDEARTILERFRVAETHLDARQLATNALLEFVTSNRSRVLADVDEALAIFRRTLGPAHRDTLELVIGYAQVACELGQIDQAEREFSEVIADVQKYLGPEHPRVASAYTHRAEMYFGLESRDAAESDIETALNLCSNHVDSGEPAWLHAAQYCVKIAARHRSLLAEAEQMATRVVSLVAAKYGPDSAKLIMPLNHLNAMRYVSREFTPETVDSMSREIELRKKHIGPRDVGAIARASNLAECLGAQKRYEEGLAVLEEPLQIVREEHAGWLGSFEHMYLSGLRASGRFAREEAFLKEIYDRELKQPLGSPEYIAIMCEHLASLYERWDKPDLAKEWTAEAQARRAALEEAAETGKVP